ncbi:MAG: ABC transporter permease, partial [Gammaproteobacteria bacterium]
MFKPLSLFIGARYLLAKRRNRFASFVAIASTVGVGLGVSVLIIVLSVMNGFEREVAAHVVGMTSHATIFKLGMPLDHWPAIAKLIREMPHVLAAEPFIRGSGMLNRRGNVRGVVIYGIPPRAEGNVSELAHYLGTAGLSKLETGEISGVIVGATLAATLDLAEGGTVSLIVPRWSPRGDLTTPSFRQLRVVGIFRVGMHEFDSSFAIVNIKHAAEFFHLGEAVSGLRIRFDDLARAKEYAQHVASELGNHYL